MPGCVPSCAAWLVRTWCDRRIMSVFCGTVKNTCAVCGALWGVGLWMVRGRGSNHTEVVTFCCANGAVPTQHVDVDAATPCLLCLVLARRCRCQCQMRPCHLV